jgi:hypothetical protein
MIEEVKENKYFGQISYPSAQYWYLEWNIFILECLVRTAVSNSKCLEGHMRLKARSGGPHLKMNLKN